VPLDRRAAARLSYPEQTLSLAALSGRDLVDSSLTIDPWGVAHDHSVAGA
jgi:hypothetical protein